MNTGAMLLNNHITVHMIWLDDNDCCQVINTSLPPPKKNKKKSKGNNSQELCPIGKLSCDQQQDIRMLQHNKKGGKNILNYM